MFQKDSQTPQSLEHVLQTELDYFNSVLTISQKVAGQVEKLPVKVLSEMVDYRKEWIEKIQLLETQRKKFTPSDVSDDSRELMKQISQIAGQLVEIDDKIYKNLERRKLAYVEQSAAVAGKSDYARKAEIQVKNTINRINIIQE